MKKKCLFKRVAAVVLSCAMLLGGTTLTSAATIKDSCTTSGNSALRVSLQSEYGDYKVTFKNKNLKTGAVRTATSKKTIKDLKLPNNVWFKTTLISYDRYGNKLSSRKYYLAKSPKLKKITLVGSNKMRVTWPKTYGAKGYEVYMGTSSSNMKKVKTTSSTSYTTGSLNKYVNYYFYVRSYKKAGGKKYYSAAPSDMRGGYIRTVYY